MSRDEGTEKWSSDDAAPSGSPAADVDPAALAGDGSHYEFSDIVGRGGVGVVVKARDRRLRRVVAIKLIPGKDPSVQARFEREAMLTARLQHPGIVPIYEVGRWPNGESYYAMRLIEGQPLSDLIAACGSLDERLALVPKVIAVAEAVAYAHTERVIHRDLKPRNVVVGAFGEVMVVDWGLAKDLTQTDTTPPEGTPALAAVRETIVGEVMGTPAYMPPEQASGQRVDERADVYALGAVLYSLLTGTAPFDGTSSAEVLRQVQHVAPRPVEERQPGVPRELAAIVAKAMCREPADRYADARELAADLKRFVTGQLVGAHHYSRRVLALRAFRRHPVIAAIALSVVALVVVGVIALRRITAEQAATESRSRELLLGQARAMLETDPTAAVALLERYPDPPSTRAEADAVRAIALDAESRGVASHVLAGHTGTVRDVAFSPDGTEVATVGADGALYVWSLATGARDLVHQSTTQMDAIRYDPRGTYLAASFGPKTGVLVWDRRARTSRVLETRDDIYTMEFTPDGATLVAGSAGGLVHVWTLATGAVRVLEGHESWVSMVIVSPDGARVLSVSTDGTARIWTLATGEARVVALDEQGYAGVFSPDGRWAAAGAIDGSVRVISVDDPAAPARVLRGDHGAVDYMAFSPDGRALAWAGMGEAIYLADLGTGDVRALHGHAEDVTGLAFLSDGTLITASADGTLRHWDLATGLAAVLRGHRDQIMGMATSADGKMIASASVDRTVRLWPLPAAPRTFVIDASRESDFRAPPTNDVLYYYQEGQRAAVLDLRTGDARPIPTTRSWTRMAGNPAGTQIAYRDGSRHISFKDLATGQEHDLSPDVALHGRVIDYTPDGRTVVFPGKDGLYVVDAATYAVRELPYPSGAVRDDEPKVGQLQFAADGKRALTVGKDLTVWDLAAGTGATVGSPPGLEWPSVVIGSPDFTVLAAGSIGGLALHDARGWRTVRTTDRAVFPITFSRDGSRFAAADDSGDLRLWRLAAGAATGEIALVGHRGPLRRLEFSADGKTLISAGTDGTVRIWDGATGEQLGAIRAHGGRAVEWAGLRGAELVTAGRDGVARVWPVVAREPKPVRALLTGLTTFRDSGR